VVGAGRSGTSAIMRGLQALSVELGDNLKAATGKNPTGFFEDKDLLDIAKRVRAALGLKAESVALLEEQSFSAPALAPLRDEAVDSIRRRFSGSPLWGFKYAQTLRMLPFWERVFEAAKLDVRYVVAARTPLSVARSRAALDPLRGIQEKSDAEWLVNVVPYFRRLAERPFVVVDYDLLMEAPVAQLERIGSWLGIALSADIQDEIKRYAESFLSSERQHTRFTERDLEEDARLNALARDAYRWLRRLAADEVETRSPELWEDWRRIEERLAGMGPLLRHVDRLEAELRRAGWSLGGGVRRALTSFPRFWRR
jgi:hypothetical protein